jgi:peptidoglycan/LPS O-acetylase OafA/YrhL
LLVVALTVLQAVYMPVSRSKVRIDRKWVDLLVCTAAVFGMLVQSYWRYRRSPKLWAALSLFLLLHAIVFGAVFFHSEQWPLPIDVIVAAGEFTLLALVVYLVFGFVPTFDRSEK